MSKFWATGSSSSSDDDSGACDHTGDRQNSNSTVGSLGFSSFDIAEDIGSGTACFQEECPKDSFGVVTIDTTAVTLPRARSATPTAEDPRVAWETIKPAQAFRSPPRRSGPPDPSRYTRIACISDTHGYHRNIPVPNCDVLIHGGDFTNFGEPEMVEDVSDYFGELQSSEGSSPPRVGSVVCIAGNHELTFEPDHYAEVWSRFHHPESGPFDCCRARKSLRNCTYLEDESFRSGEEGGLKMYGSPWQPEFGGWAFNVPRADIGDKWGAVPGDTDVLVTHGPPLGRGDRTSNGQRAGCLELLRQVQRRIKPRLHVFGHVHEGHGVSSDGTTLYVNASSVGRNYERHNPCIVVDLPHDANMPAVLVDPPSAMGQEELLDWLRRNGHNRLVPFFEKQQVSADFLLDSYRFGEVCCQLGLHRSAEAVAELKLAVMELRAFMYG